MCHAEDEEEVEEELGDGVPGERVVGEGDLQYVIAIYCRGFLNTLLE